MKEELTDFINNTVETKIYTIRGVPVMLDRDLAILYGVDTKVLNQAVKRNKERFPEWLMFQLSREDLEGSRSQFVTLNRIKRGQNIKYLPYVFTEQGVAMLSVVLKSATAIQISLQIMQVFVKLRRTGIQLSGVQQRLEWVEKKQLENDTKFDQLFSALE